MAIFYAAVEDDPLDGRGWVMDGGPCGTIKGDDGKHRRFTFLGQRAWCDKCKNAGVIVAAPGSPDKKRLNDRQHNRQQALGGDLVLCKCERKPRIVPTYGRTWKIIEDGDGANSVEPKVTPARTTAVTAAYDERFILRDLNGHSLAHIAYALRRETGEYEYGETDTVGLTHLLASVASAENISLYLAG